MNIPTSEETKQPFVAVGEAQKLAAYLRAHPEGTAASPSELAEQFRLPEEFVSSVVSGLEPRKKARELNDLRLQPLRRAFMKVRLAFRKVTRDPMTFISTTTLFAVAIFLLVAAIRSRALIGAGRGIDLTFQGNGIAFFAISAVTMLSHLACYFRHGKVRWALQGAVTVWMVTAAALIVIVWVQSTNVAIGEMILRLLLVAFLMAVLSGFYAMISAAAAILGGAFWVNREEKARENRSRQELIAHLFDLQERLERPIVDTPEQPLTPWQTNVARIRESLFPISFVAGVAHSALVIAVLVGFRVSSMSERDQRNPLFLLTEICLIFLQISAMAILSFSARGFARSTLALLVFLVGAIVGMLLPIPPFGISGERIASVLSVNGLIESGILLMLTAALGTLAARVEAKTQENVRLVANDRAALLAEIVRTEWQLQLQSRNVCVMVVDAAKSSVMKQNAHPLLVEYSFREYQNYLSEISTVYSGIVHSTAGDGAVVAFPDSQSAFDAACRIQMGLAEFNQTRNRLSSPFELRIGLHLGSVAGDLNDVQFTEVIDIAAHVESRCPVGEIALTQPVAEHLPGARIVGTSERVSGFAISIAPMEDA